VVSSSSTMPVGWLRPTMWHEDTRRPDASWWNSTCPGRSFSTEGFMLDGQAHIPAIFDRNYEYWAGSRPLSLRTAARCRACTARCTAGR